MAPEVAAIGDRHAKRAQGAVEQVDAHLPNYDRYVGWPGDAPKSPARAQLQRPGIGAPQALQVPSGVTATRVTR